MRGKISYWMRKVPASALALALVVGSAAEEAGAEGNREICITFDEMPAAQGFDSAGPAEVLVPILETLKKHHVQAAGFVLGQNLEGSFDLLGEWLNDGHTLGSMTYAQSDLHEVAEISIEAYIADIVAGQQAIEPMLEGFGQEQRYFRYPYLHYGNTIAARRPVEKYLEANNITASHVTVLVDDYLYNLGLQKMGPEPNAKEYEQLMNEYINHVLDQIEDTEQLSMTVLGRSCRQILQLRANRLNAMYLDVLLREIKKLGYEFVSLDKALADEVYRKPHAYYGSRGVGFLQMLDESDPDLLPAGE